MRFLGDSLTEVLARLPRRGTARCGYQLDKVQRGDQPDDFKPMPSIGRGVEEVRVSDSSGAYRIVYVARRRDAVYVLHAFQKKTQATANKDIEIAKKLLGQLLGGKA